MFFFMTRRRLETYVEERCSRIVEQYRLEDIADFHGKVSDAIWKVEGDVGNLAARTSELEKRPAARTSDEWDAEISKYQEKLKRDVMAEVEAELSKTNASVMTDDDVRQMVDQAVAERMSAVAGFENKLAEARDAWQTELNGHVEQVTRSYFDGMHRELANKDAEIQQLKAAIYNEKKNNADLQERIKKQEKDVMRLSAVILNMRKEFGILAERVSRAERDADGLTADVVSEPVYVDEKAEETAAVPIQKPADKKPDRIAAFGDDLSENRSTLAHFILQTRKLRSQLETLFGEREEGIIYLKLVDKCIRKFETLAGKNQEKAYEAGKLANESVKIFGQTIARAMSQEKLKPLLEQYMQACRLRKLEWHIGKKLEDDDYDYLDEPILYTEVSVPELHNTITDIRQDAYIIDYREDDSQFEAVISGIYSIGKYRS